MVQHLGNTLQFLFLLVLINNKNSWTEESFSFPEEIFLAEITGSPQTNCIPDDCSSGYEPYHYECDSKKCSIKCEKIICDTSSARIIRDGLTEKPEWNEYNESEIMLKKRAGLIRKAL